MKALALDILLLCFTTALCTWALVSKGGAAWAPARLLTDKKRYAAAVAVLLAAAVLVRVWQFGAVPSGLNQDEAMAAVDANALAHYGTDRFGTRLPVYFEAWGYGQMSVLLSYCMAPFIRLFGLTPAVIRLPMLLASLAGIWVLFRFTKRAFGAMPALAVLLFAAINPWHIMQSRWSLDCNLLPHLLLFSLYLLYIGLDKRAYLYVSMVLFGLTMYTYGIAFFSIPLLLVALCAYLIARRRIKAWEAVVCAFIYLAVAWPIFAVVAINTLKLPTLNTGVFTIQFFPDSIRMNDLIVYSKDFFGQLASNIRSFTDMAMLERGDFSWNYVRGYGHMYLFTLPFVITGLWGLFRRRAAEDESKEHDIQPGAMPAPDPAARYMVGAWLAAAVLTGLMINNVNTNRINIVFYPMMLLAALGIWNIVSRAPQARRVAAAVCALYLISFGSFSYTYFGEHAKTLAKDFCSGLTDAIRYADGLDTDVLYVTAYSRSEDAYTCSQVYTLFGADVDARYFQGVAGAVNRTTGKALLPYKERYQYVDFDTFAFDRPAGTVYMYNAAEAAMFDAGGYDIRPFGDFCVAVQTADPQPETVEPDGSDGGDAEYEESNEYDGIGDGGEEAPG